MNGKKNTHTGKRVGEMHELSTAVHTLLLVSVNKVFYCVCHPTMI